MGKNWLYLLAMIVLLAGVAYIGRAPEEPKENIMPEVTAVGESDVQAEIEDRPRQYSSIQEAQKEADFQIIIPQCLEQDYIPGKVIIDTESIVEIHYYGEENQIIYRTGQGLGNISGDYTLYDNEERLDSQGISVTAKGSGARFSLAYFTLNNLKYALSFQEPVPKQDLLDIISSLP